MTFSRGAGILCFAASMTVALPAAADPVTEQVRRFADATAGQAAEGDKVLTFARRGRELVVTSMAIVEASGDPAPPAGSVAVLRTRAVAGDNPEMPLPADFAFVGRTGARLFVVAEWARPAVVWEIQRDREMGPRFRTIDGAGRPGAWAIPANAPVETIGAR